ncbi:MAG TPA: serine/threonine protein kinase [Burkholderiaceae bacterium]|nr:serine/threonine protein kinase [Burkholderiaceae bacterium]HYA75900.1 serine/threonine protein kinase [Burkholderiaceae bacterium]
MSSESNFGERGPGRQAASSEEPFAELSPDALLNAIDAALEAGGLLGTVRTSGQVLPLNSYENRVFQVGLEAVATQQLAAPVVVKFYRPGRWTDEQILEEHAFLEELVQAEVPAVPAVRCGGRTLHHVGGFRFAIFERRGGRTPELSDPAVRERIGRFLGRLHAVGRRTSFVARRRLDVLTFGAEPSAFLLDNEWLPPELSPVYRGLIEQALGQIRLAFERAPVAYQRVHGDCHPGNLLWSESAAEPGPHFVDFDDSCMAPVVQDLWMLLSGDSAEMARQLRDVLRGYELFSPFDFRQLLLIEPLRTLRLIHYAAWIARRWRDPAFPAAFPWFGEPRYWEERVLELREQLAAMQEAPLEL